jgi:hypothetical protein
VKVHRGEDGVLARFLHHAKESPLAAELEFAVETAIDAFGSPASPVDASIDRIGASVL